MPELVPLFLTIHILTAIVAFGPTFIFAIIARMAAQEPQHGLFALRLTDRIERLVVIPVALLMPVSGVLLVWSEGIDLAATHWLVLAIGLYIVAITFAILIQLRTIDRMIELATGMAAAGPVLAAGPGAALATPPERSLRGAANPAAEMAALGSRAQKGGIFLVVMVIVIVSLMSGKPTI
jgi:Predicted integral membrane protein (DUF2269)